MNISGIFRIRTGALISSLLCVFSSLTTQAQDARLSADYYHYATESGPAIQIEVWRSSEVNRTISVDYVTSNGTAVASQDYVPAQGTLTFAPGQMTNVISIQLINDDIQEPTEIFYLILKNPSPGTRLEYGQSEQENLMVINDDDLHPAGKGLTVDGSFNNNGGPVGGFTYPFWFPGRPPNASVSTIVRDLNGKILIGGNFTLVDGLARSGIARLNPDGSLDPTFNPGSGASMVSSWFSPLVNTVVVQPDGKILVGGDFTELNGRARPGIGRLNADGSHDDSFVPGSGTNSVAAIALENTGKILVGGSFTNFNNSGVSNLARLNLDGSVDPTFRADIDGQVNCLIVTSNHIWAAGFFRNTNWAVSGRVWKLDRQGLKDPSFQLPVGPNGPVVSMVLQPNEKIVIAGNFVEVAGVSRKRIARINPDGTHDVDFNIGTGFDDMVNRIHLQEDGKIVAGGSFVNFNGLRKIRLARLLPDGALDSTLDTGRGPDFHIHSLAAEPGGKILIGGAFKQVDGFSHPGIARIFGDVQAGAAIAFSEENFLVNEPDGESSIVLERRGSTAGEVKVRLMTRDADAIAGVHFQGQDVSITFAPGEMRRTFRLPIFDDGRFNADRSLSLVLSNETSNIEVGNRATLKIRNNDELIIEDYSFQPPAFNGRVSAIARDQSGRLLVGGWFYRIGEVVRPHIARLLPDGTLDPSFNPLAGLDAEVRQIFSLTNGKVLIAGLFTNFNGVPRQGIAMLNEDGSLDPGFNPFFTGGRPPYIFLVQPDGKILFNNPLTALGRLNANGTPDLTFRPPSHWWLGSVALQPDGKLLLFGAWWDPQPNPLIRVNPDGSTDPTFNAAPQIFSSVLTVSPEGKIFATRTNASGGCLIRLNADGSHDQDLVCETNFFVDEIFFLPQNQLLVRGNFGIRRLNSDGSRDHTLLSPFSYSLPMVVEEDGKVIIATWAGLSRVLADSTLSDRVEFSVDSISVRESDQEVTLRLQRTGTTSERSVVQVETRPLTATASEDFIPFRSEIIFESLESSKTVSFFVRGDDIPERDETVEVVVTNLTARTVCGKKSRVTVKILDEDGRLGAAELYQSSQSGIQRFAVANDGSIVFAEAVGELNRSRIRKLSPEGQLDLNFTEWFTGGGQVNELIVQEDGKIIVCGSFSHLNDQPIVFLARLNTDGSLDETFRTSLGTNNHVGQVIQDPVGKLVAVVSSNQAGLGSKSIWRFMPDGRRDLDFTSTNGFFNFVYSMLFDSDGKILLDGFGSDWQHRIVRFNTNGTMDLYTSIGVTWQSFLLPHENGKFLLAGYVGTNYGIFRYFPDGSLDETYRAEFPQDRTLKAHAIQPDHRLLFSFNPPKLVRLNRDGTLDPQFDPPEGLDITQMVARGDDLFLSGNFSGFSGKGIAKVKLRMEPRLHLFKAGSGLGLRLMGENPAAYRFQSSRNLQEWSDLGGSHPLSDYATELDATLPMGSVEFFRAVSVP